MIMSLSPSSRQMCSNSGSSILVTTRANPSERPTMPAMILVWSLSVRQNRKSVWSGSVSRRIAGLLPSPCTKPQASSSARLSMRALSCSTITTSWPRLSRSRVVVTVSALLPTNTAFIIYIRFPNQVPG